MKKTWESALCNFSILMRHKLWSNEHKPGWSEEPIASLVERMHEETKEMAEEIMHFYNAKGEVPIFRNLQKDAIERALLECADVANFAMMIADRLLDEEGVAKTYIEKQARVGDIINSVRPKRS